MESKIVNLQEIKKPLSPIYGMKYTVGRHHIIHDIEYKNIGSIFRSIATDDDEICDIEVKTRVRHPYVLVSIVENFPSHSLLSYVVIWYTYDFNKHIWKIARFIPHVYKNSYGDVISLDIEQQYLLVTNIERENKNHQLRYKLS